MTHLIIILDSLTKYLGKFLILSELIKVLVSVCVYRKNFEYMSYNVSYIN